MSETFGPLLAFVLVIGMIPVALWLLKRTPIGGAGAGRGLRSVGVLALSNTQRIVTVEVGIGAERRWLVLGVTPAGINTLHTMAPPDDAALGAAAPASNTISSSAAAAPLSGFGELLARLRSHRDERHAR
jgi:flagellar protein FliO/FliZ